MALTPAQIQTLINTNLASGSTITAAEHREVETELLNLIKTAIPLAKGIYNIGNVVNDNIFTITFPDVGTSNYYVMGSIKSNGANYINDDDVIWVWREPTSTSFKLGVGEGGGNTQNISFYWELKSL